MTDLPPLALETIPVLVQEIDRAFPGYPAPEVFAGQIEQETCPSLTSKKCWNPRTELKTEREYGFGLGQLTVTSRFNAWEEVKTMDPSLKPWKWEDRFNVQYQLRALVVKDAWNWRQFPLAADSTERTAFMLASYNGGVGGTINDVKLCKAQIGCDPAQWFDNVELTSSKSRTKWKGYGKSAFEINREYPYNIIYVRSDKYKEVMR